MVLWIALAVFLAALAGGVSYAVIRAIQLWRNLKRGGSRLNAAIGQISEASLRIEVQISKAEAAAGRLRDAGDRLASSRARLDVLLAAPREAHSQLRRLLWFVPGM